MDLRRFGSKARRVKSRASIDDDSSVAELRERYVAVLFLLGRWALAASDHATDAAVMWDLFMRGHPWVAATGLAIDLLPGLVTVAHFTRYFLVFVLPQLL